MTPDYTYIPSKEFIQELIFDHIETYSLQRGADYEMQQQAFELKWDQLKSRKVIANDLTEQEEEELFRLEKLCRYTQYLLDENNQFHYSAKKITTFAHSDKETGILIDILNTEIKVVPSWMCAPVYRDAVIFFDSRHAIVGVLNVCLGCEYMETAKFKHIQADYQTYDLLKRFFIEIGHDVEDPEDFPFEELKRKYGGN